MPQKIASQKNSIIAVVAVLIVLGGGYYWYSSSQNSGISVDTIGVVDPTLFSPDVQTFYNAKDNINLKEKDMAFIKKAFYTQLKDNTVDIPSVEPTGRPNPFWAP